MSFTATLRTNALVERLETSPSGREVTKVIVNSNGKREEITADVFVLSCGAINSAALLLRSRNDHHPRGLANSSDVVDRHYMGHVNSVQMALTECPNSTIFQKTLSINDGADSCTESGVSGTRIGYKIQKRPEVNQAVFRKVHFYNGLAWIWQT